METIGEKIKNLRNKVGLTQKQLGDILHVSFQAVSKWERDLGLPDPSLFPDIAKALKTDVNQLFYDDLDNFKPTKCILDSATFDLEDKDYINSGKKSVYRSINWVFYTTLSCVMISVLLVCTIFTTVFIKNYGYKNDLFVASRVFANENNVCVNLIFNGKTYVYVRKCFFDGKVIYCIIEDQTKTYYYEDYLYTEENGTVSSQSISLLDFLTLVPNFYTVVFNKEDFKDLKYNNNHYTFLLKNIDNLPIAPLFGFSSKANIKVYIKNGKIKSINLTEKDNKMTISYCYGYDFVFLLPNYING